MPSGYSNKYRLKISYEGTEFSGWQIQPNSLSIQELIENALGKILKQTPRVVGSGRTDAGVHALGQEAHFTHSSDIDCQRVFRALNAILPGAVRILSLMPVQDHFHAQYSALSKEYHYHLWLEPALDPFKRHYRHHVCFPDFSLDRLQAASAYFLGTHDFATFANVGGPCKSTVRTLFRLDTIQEEGGVRLEFEGNGFLYKMVRNIVGTLIEVARGKRDLEQIPTLFKAKDRRLGAMAAPARGLFLMRVRYPEEFFVNLEE